MNFSESENLLLFILKLLNLKFVFTVLPFFISSNLSSQLLLNSFLVIMSLKMILIDPIQIKIIILNLILKYLNQTQINYFNFNSFKSNFFNLIISKLNKLLVLQSPISKSHVIHVQCLSLRPLPPNRLVFWVMFFLGLESIILVLSFKG